MINRVGWHFLCEDRRLQFDPCTPVEVGQKIVVEPPIKMCKRGLHASKNALDALGYAPGPIVCRVRLSGQIIKDNDKAVATERTVLKMGDATKVLYEFACWSAEQALIREREAGREPDPRSWKAIEVRREWLNDQATDQDLIIAEIAAHAAAWCAANDAIEIAAWAAKAAVKRDAVSAAHAAATYTTRQFKARSEQNKHLEDMLTALLYPEREETA